MSNMKELDIVIQDIAKGDKTRESKMIDDIDAHMNGILSFGEMCVDAQRAMEEFECGQTEEIHGTLETVKALNKSDDDSLTVNMEEEDYGSSERSLLK